MQKTLILTAASALAIHNKRTPVEYSDKGQQLTLVIQGNGTFITAAEQEAANPGQKQYFDKLIYNLKAASQEAISRAENRKLFTLGKALEKAGRAEEADVVYRQWLNATQISFNVIAERGQTFSDGDAVTAFIEIVETKDGRQAIAVRDVKYKAPIAKSVKKYDVTDLCDDEDSIELPDEVISALNVKNVLTK